MLARYNTTLSTPAPLSTLLEDMNHLLDDLASPVQGWLPTAGPALPAEVQEDAEELTISVDLPGHDPSHIDVQVEHDVLTVRSERKDERTTTPSRRRTTERTYGTFARSFVLPATVDASRCAARYEHGVLTLTLPKREEAKPRAIQVKVSS